MSKKSTAKASSKQIPETQPSPVTETTAEELIIEIEAAAATIDPTDAQPETDPDFVDEETMAEKAMADAVATATENPDGKVIFVSTEKTLDTTIRVANTEYRGVYDANRKHLIWHVAPEHADMFAAHTFVKHGRIVRAL